MAIAEPRSLIESIPDDELAEPKRGGRVLSDNPAARKARERRAAMKAQGQTGKKPAKRSSAPRTRSAPKSLYPELAATFTMLNMVIVMSPLGSRSAINEATGQIEVVRVGDELDEAEIVLLAQSIDAQAQRSPRFRKQVERILGVGASGTLITTVGIIAARRAARHGILPEMLDPMLGGIIAGGDLGALGSFVAPDAPKADAPVPETGERPPMPLDDATDVDFDTL